MSACDPKWGTYLGWNWCNFLHAYQRRRQRISRQITQMRYGRMFCFFVFFWGEASNFAFACSVRPYSTDTQTLAQHVFFPLKHHHQMLLTREGGVGGRGGGGIIPSAAWLQERNKETTGSTPTEPDFYFHPHLFLKRKKKKQIQPFPNMPD